MPKRIKRSKTATDVRGADAEKLEAQREALLRRLAYLGERAKDQRGYTTAHRLLNQKFRKATLAARLGILQAAGFMIDILERTIPFA